MSKKETLPSGRLAWLKSIDAAITGLFGAFVLGIAYEGAAIVFNPSHLVVVFGLKINWHFFNMIYLGTGATFAFILKVIWGPVAQGLKENELKLYFTGLAKQYNRLTEALDTEYGGVLLAELIETVKKKKEQNDSSKSEVKPSMDNKADSPGMSIGNPRMPWNSSDSQDDVGSN